MPSAEEMEKAIQEKHRELQLTYQPQGEPGTIIEPIPDTIWMIPRVGGITGKAGEILASVDPGEPIFVFRAHDILSSFAIEAYLTLLEKFNPHSPQVESCTRVLKEFRHWQQVNPSKVKLPD